MTLKYDGKQIIVTLNQKARENMLQTIIKSAETIVKEAMAEVPTISVEEAQILAVSGNYIFVDLRAEKNTSKKMTARPPMPRDTKKYKCELTFCRRENENMSNMAKYSFATLIGVTQSNQINFEVDFL